MHIKDITRRCKDEAKKLGFQDIGISKAEPLDEEAKKLENWLKKGYEGDMSYMERNFDLRIDPRLLHPGTKSIISLSYNYYQPMPDSELKIAKYALGRDYHKVVKKKLKKLIQWFESEVGEISARGFVDSAPVMERAWAEKSGVGWIGKNAMLLTKAKGSFFFLAELFIDIDLEYDTPVKNYCGQCTKCIDACPTQAIVAPYQIDSNKCISYLTIEYKKETIREDLVEKMNSWVFGCDVCQDICPINARAKQHSERDFQSKNNISNMKKQDWLALTEEEFNTMFYGTPVMRTGYVNFMRNIKANYRY